MVSKRTMAKLEKKVPKVAVAALNAAHQRALATGLPLVMVIDGGLYRVTAEGRELIRMLPTRTKVAKHRKRSRS